MKRTLYIVATALIASTALVACNNAPDLLKAMAADPSAVSVRQQITAPGWSVVTEVTRANSTGTAVTAGDNGVTISVPQGATANTAITPSAAATAPAVTPE